MNAQNGASQIRTSGDNRGQEPKLSALPNPSPTVRAQDGGGGHKGGQRRDIVPRSEYEYLSVVLRRPGAADRTEVAISVWAIPITKCSYTQPCNIAIMSA